MKAAKSAGEAARIAALRSYDVLDTPRETNFDEIVEVVADQCEAPIAVINLIDEDRQWFKAETGLGVRETPLDTSICAHAILQQDFFIVEDTLSDPRFCDNPLCLDEPNLRFYAGALLKSPEGFPLGTLCVLDTKPRKLSPQQKRLVEVMAKQVMFQLEAHRKIRQQFHHAREATHRTKNVLSVVHSLFHRTKANAVSLDELEHKFEARLVNLGRVHELLASGQWKSADILSIIDAVTTDFESALPGQIAVTGPPVTLEAGAAANVALAIYELATNAAKYGALSTKQGRVEIKLTHDRSGLVLEWLERGGPPVTTPDSEGLGAILIRDVSAAAVHGEASLDYAPKGVRWRLKIGPEFVEA